MIRNLRRRLEFVESKIPRQPTEQEKLHAWISQFMLYAIAFYLGEPKPEESIMATITRPERATIATLGKPRSAIISQILRVS
jgi:hypothetical protein